MAKITQVDRAILQAPLNAPLTPEDEELQQQEDDFLNVDVQEEPDDTGGATIIFGEQTQVEVGTEPDNFYDNLTESLQPNTLTTIANYVRTSVEDDRASREDWEETYTKGLDLLGLKYEARNQPFEGATGVIHPILNEAVTQFQAGAYKEMLPSTGPVRANIVGNPQPQTEQQAQRVQDFLNYQLMYKMDEYEPEFDQMLYFLGLAGSSFKKVYKDDVLARPVSKFVPAEDIIVPYTAVDLRTADRVTHVIRMSKNDLRKLQINGVYRDIEVTDDGNANNTEEIQEKYDQLDGVSPSGDTQDEISLYECHCYLDLEEYPDTDTENNETGIKLPYIATVVADTQQVLSVRRNYKQTDPQKTKIAHFVQYKFTPGLGFYGFGLIHLLGNLSRTATANLRQLIDAGTLSNMPAGFKARGLRISDDQNPLQPGEFRDVDVPGGDLRTSLMPLPYKEPSGTLFQLMGFVVESAQRFIGTTDIGVGDGKQEMPVGTTIALLERGARIISAVHKRLHASLKQELKMIASIFAEDPTPYPYDVGVDQQIKASDFDDRVDILPVSDPNIFSMSQRVVLAQEQLKLAQSAPELHNINEAYRRVYQALGVTNIEQILKQEPVPQPMDPATENQLASQVAGGQGQLQAFPGQDHDAHIAVHLAYMNSRVAQMQPPILLTLEKHIYEHLGLKAQEIYQQQMTQTQQQVPPEIQAGEVAKLQAQLVMEFQQQNPPQAQQDPLVQVKQQELALREKEMQMDNATDQQRLQIDQARNQENANIARERIQSTEGIADMRARIALERTRK